MVGSGLSSFQFLLGGCVFLFLRTNPNAALICTHRLPIIAWMAGWYVTVNVTNSSHNCCLASYQAVLRRSLTPLHFIIPRLASVLGSDRKFCYGFTDNITGKYNPGKNRRFFFFLENTKVWYLFLFASLLKLWVLFLRRVQDHVWLSCGSVASQQRALKRSVTSKYLRPEMLAQLEMTDVTNVSGHSLLCSRFELRVVIAWNTHQNNYGFSGESIPGCFIPAAFYLRSQCLCKIRSVFNYMGVNYCNVIP